jgi:hypothetical protein
MDHIEVFRGERTKGASIGATIVGGFGAAWLAMGMASAGAPVRIALAVVVPVFVLIACLGSTVRRRLPKLAGAESPEKTQMKRALAVVNVVQWFAIFGTVNLLRNLHLDAWVVPAIVLIVGAHFIPLARIFQAPQHLKTGVAMMLCAATAIVLPVSIRDTVECLSAGLILWASAAGALYAAFRAAFRMAPSSALAPQAGLQE